MNITVTENWEGMYFEKSATANMRGVQIEGPVTYDVVVDENVTTREGLILAVQDSRIPNVYDLHPNSAWAFVSSVRAEPKGPKHFLVTVNYEAIEDPLAEDAETQWTSTTTTEPIDVDADDEPITNSAGEPPDPPLTEDFHDEVLRRRYKSEDFDSILAGEYRGKLNSDEFMGRQPGTCKLVTFNATEKRTGFGWYYDIDVEIHVRNDGWEKRFEDRGMREIVGVKDVIRYAGADPVYIPDYQDITSTLIDENGDEKLIPVTEPVALDGNGRQLTDGAEPVYITRQTKKMKPFALLGIA